MQTPLHLLRVTLQSIRDAVVTTDAAARVQTLNLAAEAMTGWSQAESIGRPVEDVIELRESLTDNLLLNPTYTALRDGVRTSPPGRSMLIGRGGRRTAVEISATPLQEEDGTLLGCVLIFHNVSEAEQLAERIAHQAHYDPLTGLPNRIMLVDRMEQATKVADRHSDQLAVLALAVQPVSEASGSPVQPGVVAKFTDELPREAASRLTANLRESDTVCRLSGSEFVVLLSGVKSLANVELLAAKLITELTRPYVLKRSAEQNLPPNTLATTCNIGISLYPQDASDAGTLMSLADGAMHQARRYGPNHYLFTKTPVAHSVANR